MSRANGRDTRIRAALESIAAELAVMKDASPIVRLRMDQAARRSGLSALLDPAMMELDQMVAAVATAQAQVCSALAELIEKDDATHVY